MEIETIKGSFEEWSSFRKKHKFSSDTEYSMFGVSSDACTDTSTSILAKNDGKLVGVIVFKMAVLQKKDYLQITAFLSDSLEVAQLLVEKLLILYKENKANFILTPYLKHESYEARALSRWKEYEQIFGSSKSTLMNRISSSTIEYIQMNKTNRRSYSRIFNDLLLEFDSQENKGLNESAGENILPTNLRKESKHRIRISYFISNVVSDKSWYAYLMLDDDEEVIGFVKGKYRQTKTMLVDFFITDKTASDTSLMTFLKNTPNADILMVTSKKNDHWNLYKRWFGKSSGCSFFYS